MNRSERQTLADYLKGIVASWKRDYCRRKAAGDGEAERALRLACHYEARRCFHNQILRKED